MSLAGLVLFQILYDVFQRNGLEGDVGGTAFVENTYGFAVNHRQAGVAPADGFVEKQLVGFVPGLASVKTCLDGNVMAFCRSIRIGKQQDVALQCVVVSLHMEQTRHAYGLLQRVARG